MREEKNNYIAIQFHKQSLLLLLTCLNVYICMCHIIYAEEVQIM